MGTTSKKTVTRSAAPARRVSRSTADPGITSIVSDDQVAQLAYRYYEESGFADGNDLEHWLRAESELRGR